MTITGIPKHSLWSVLFLTISSILSLARAGILLQEQYIDPESKEPLGTRDLITTGVDQRVKATRAAGGIQTYEFETDVGLRMDVGAGAWGSIQVSALITQKPNGFKLQPEFCSVAGESTTNSLTSYLRFTDNSRIVDYETSDDLVYLLTNSKLVTCVKVTGIENTILSTQWVSNALATMIGDVFTGEAINVGLGYDKNTGYLYVPSANGLFRIAQSNQGVAKVADGGVSACRD